jgi:FlaA1/EpsC-like NDP-sugar epimerase
MVAKRLSRVVDTLLRRHAIFLFLLHLVLILCSLTIASLLQFDFTLMRRNLLFASAPVLLIVRLCSIARFKLLHGNWRYTGVDDVAEIFKATLVGSVAFFVVVRLFLHITAFPLALYFTEGIVSGLLLGGTRLGFRIIGEAANRMPPGQVRKQILIIGAGFAGQMIIRELRQSTSSYWVVGLLDDDPHKLKRRVQGKVVLGTVSQLPEVAGKHAIDEVLIAVPSASGAQMRRFVQICENAGLKSSTVPALKALISGKSKINELHEVNLDDLLGREPVSVDLNSVRHVLTGQIVLVTGAAGSIGSELCRQILEYDPTRLVCVDQNETGLFYLQMELDRTPQASRVTYCVADYTNSERMRRIFGTHKVDIVFHAAAYKHVPLMEHNMREALQNNVFGLLRLLDVANATGCESFVLISTDKAVNPTSIMGCSKRICELIMSSFPSTGMRCVSVRFGNVLGSQGSVVPVFQKQLSEKGQITVTHPEITRFFMTIQEAVALVLQAGAIGCGGDVLVLDMGEPVRIVDLAQTLIRLSGKSDKDVEIVFTGLRPGEKLYEELFYPNEEVLDTTCKKIKRTCVPVTAWAELKSDLESMKHILYSASEHELRLKLQTIVPEYCAPEETKKTTPFIGQQVTRALAHNAGA